jgi:phosphonate transport system substrate-binding protein
MKVLQGGGTINRQRNLKTWIVFLLVLLGVSGCGGRRLTPVPTVIVPTRVPTATPLPPLPTVPAPGSQDNPFTLLLVTSEGDQRAAQALGSAIADASGGAVRVELGQSYAEAYRALCSGEADLVSLDAFSYLAASERGCGVALYIAERNGQTATQAQLIADARTAVRAVRDFNEERFCRPGPDSVLGWIIPSLVLRANGVDPFSDLTEVLDAGSDADVVRMVHDGQCEVGATTLGAEESVQGLEDPARIRIIDDTLAPVPNDAVVLSLQLDERSQAVLKDALRPYLDDLAALLGVESLREAGEGDYADLRGLFEAAGVNILSLAQ